MKIYTNGKHRITALNSTSDTALTEYTVERDAVFGTRSDFELLTLCYEPGEHGYAVYPAIMTDQIPPLAVFAAESMQTIDRLTDIIAGVV
ncbi:MAG: hypothetical protein RR235_04235 [Oscillospiraceae bacterium]